MGPTPPGPSNLLPPMDAAGTQQAALNTQTAQQQQGINTQTAQQQAKQNTKTANQQQAFNVASQAGSMPNQSNPFGDVNYVQTGVGPNGVPIYTAKASFSAPEQGVFGAQVGGQMALGSEIPGLIASGNYGSGSPAEAIGNMTSGITGQNLAKEVAGLDPFFQMQDEQEESKLYNQGLSPRVNPQGWNAAMAPFKMSQDSTVAQFLASQEPTVQAQSMQEYKMPWDMATGALPFLTPSSPTSIASGLPGLSGTNVTPTTIGGTTVTPTNELSALGPFAAAQTAQAQQQQAQYNAMIQALGSGASAAASVIPFV